MCVYIYMLLSDLASFCHKTTCLSLAGDRHCDAGGRMPPASVNR